MLKLKKPYTSEGLRWVSSSHWSFELYGLAVHHSGVWVTRTARSLAKQLYKLVST
jgi:hypothetical protein